MSSPTRRRPNHLDGETSPYLLQHRFNPVDWYPWGEAALERARALDRPIFLSIGYSACHWCHVMERESFENEALAAVLNDAFVAIKVDREERPDLDEIYMTAVHLMTGQGGWPLNVFLTPDGRPFYGGTYFPPDDRWGRHGFATILDAVREAWRARRGDLAHSADAIAGHLRAITAIAPGDPAVVRVGRRESARAAADLAARFDPVWGGFAQAPKFPPHGGLALLLREHARTGDPAPLRMAETTLDRMARGGMYDQIGGGFARYSTDERWLVPHFEKMLYDQALLVPVYVDAWRILRKPLYRRVVLETLDFVRRELSGPAGELHASLDADSDGHEGRFYVWTPGEIETSLGPEDGRVFSSVYGITADGNFEGASIPHLIDRSLQDHAEASGTGEEELVARLAPMKAKLLEARARRVRPATDDKVLTAWNGLMISAFARAYEAFGRPADLDSARRAADFLAAHLASGDRLRAAWRSGRARLNAYLDDYAFTARGLLDLYEAAFDRADLDRAAAYARTALARFGDGRGGFHFTSDDHEALLARTSSVHDGALPAGSGVAARVLARLAVHLNDGELRNAADGVLRALAPACAKAPSAFTTLLGAADFVDGPVVEIVVAGQEEAAATRALLDAARQAYLPARVLAWCDPSTGGSELPLLRGKTLVGGAPAAYVCREYACDAPLADPAALARVLASRSAG